MFSPAFLLFQREPATFVKKEGWQYVYTCVCIYLYMYKETKNIHKKLLTVVTMTMGQLGDQVGERYVNIMCVSACNTFTWLK